MLKPAHTIILLYAALLVIILAPFLLFGAEFDQFAVEMMDGKRTLEMFTITTLLLMSDIFIPVPSSAVSVSAGIIMGMPMAFMACLLGQTLGCLIGYAFGYYFRHRHFDRWHSDQEFRFLSADLSRYGAMVLVVLRGVPILAEMSVVVAGFHRFVLWQFFVATLIGNIILAGLYSYLGDSAAKLTSVYLVIAGFLAIPMITYSAKLLWQKRISNNTVS